MLESAGDCFCDAALQDVFSGVIHPTTIQAWSIYEKPQKANASFNAGCME